MLKLSIDDTATQSNREEEDRRLRRTVDNALQRDADIRADNFFQRLLGQQSLEDQNPLLMILMMLFLGPDAAQQILEDSENRARDYADNSSDYGTITRPCRTNTTRCRTNLQGR